MPIITLMTDFGIKDGNVGLMKGVILGIAPQAQIVDLSHLVEPQNISEASLILARSAPYFPSQSIHVVVVDPGVGTVRRSIAAQLGTQYFVGPDNGLVTLLLDHAIKANWPVEFVHLDRPKYWLDDVSYVFHGRDIFSPVAARIANGVALHELGTIITDPVRLAVPKPELSRTSIKGEIIHIDHFGNAASNIRVEHVLDLLQNSPTSSAQNSSFSPPNNEVFPVEGRLRQLIGSVLNEKQRFIVRIADEEIQGLVDTFGERHPGEQVTLFGSTGNLIVSVVNGNFASQYSIKPGQAIELRINR